MIVNNILLNDMEALGLDTTIEQALFWVEESALSHLPVVDNQGYFLGCLASESILNLDLEEKVSSLRGELLNFSGLEGSLYLEIIPYFSEQDSNILAIIDQEYKYKGYVLAEDLLKELSKLPMLSEPGGIVIIKNSVRKYSVSEIAKIVESNNSRLLGCFISSFEGDELTITLKLGLHNISGVLRTFERFGYQVLESQFRDEKEVLMKDRYKHLIKFLNI